MNKRYFAWYHVFFIIIILAFFLRLYYLDERVFHQDEAAVGYITYKLFNESVYSYDPSFHGPFMYYVTSEMYRLLGDSIFTSRLLPAILGASMIFLLLPLRRYLGNSGILFAAFFLALSPSFLYYSRFYREDIFISFFSLLAFVCAVKYAEALNTESRSFTFFNFHYISGYSIERIFYLALAGISISFLGALKENAYITIALIALFLFLFFIRERHYRSLVDRKRPDKEFIILIAEIVFLILIILVVFSLFYTGNILDIAGMKTTIQKAVSLWYEMHRIQRLGGPYFFYLGILALYELPILVFGILGMLYYGSGGRKKGKLLMVLLLYWAAAGIMYLISDNYAFAGRFLPTTYIQSSIIIFLPLILLGIIGVLYIRNLFFAFLIFWGLTNFFVYSYVQEKVQWLVMNPLLPLVLIAAAYLGEMLPTLNLRSRAGTLTIIFLIAGSLFFVYSGIQLNYVNYANTIEPMVQASQPPQKFSEFVTKMSGISSQYGNESTRIQVTDENIETMLLWYTRHYPNVEWRTGKDARFNAPLIIVPDPGGNGTEPDIMQRNLGSDYIRLNGTRMSWYWFRPSDLTPEFILFRTMNRQPDFEHRFTLFYKPVIK
ncbi:Uncharacterised protein [uncultured archaeon]|nr:Uncharacterised protein [uncultured archaeon]